MFNAAIFDMDGMLIDSERAIMRARLTAARAPDTLRGGLVFRGA